MGRKRQLTVERSADWRPLELPDGLRRRRPRAYGEWRALRAWGRLPEWEESPAGYLLRELREESGLTQEGLAGLLGCSQQAIAQAERWAANPSVRFISSWAGALGRRLELQFPKR